MGDTARTRPDDHPRCVIPNCANDVDSWGDVCQGCRSAFGTRLRPTTTRALTRRQIAERDHHVERAIAAHRRVRAGTPGAAASPRRSA